LRPFAKDILQARLTSFATTVIPENKGDVKEFPHSGVDETLLSINENGLKVNRSSGIKTR
jgi:hypothetical protein